MTENQLFPISGEFYDNSSNSNFLKLDLLSPGSNSNTSICGINNSGITVPLTAGLYPKEDKSLSNYRDTNKCRDFENIPSASISIPKSTPMSYITNKMSEYADYGYDVLDMSTLSPTLLQSESSTLCQNLENSKTTSSIEGNSLSYNINSDDLIEGNINQATSNIWDDISSAITTKQEPYAADEDYIFQIDRHDLNMHQVLPDLNDSLLQDVNIDDLISGDQLLSNSTQINSMLNPHQLYDQNSQSYQHLSLQTTANFEIYHSTPNKLKTDHSADSSGIFSSSSDTSGLLPINSNISPQNTQHMRQQYQSIPIKSRNLNSIKKEYSMSPDRHISDLGQSVPNSQLLLPSSSLSPSSMVYRNINGNNINVGNVTKSFGYQNISRLSSSAPTHLGLEQIWQRREPRQHLLSTGSLAEAESFSSLGTSSILSPDMNEYSQEDDGFSDSDNYEDLSSDGGSDNEELVGMDTSTQRRTSVSKQHKERFFWQYNVQAKGPKGQRLVIKSNIDDPHHLNEVTDPVFSPNCSVRGIKHSGKARKGDGNDLTPNPKKLFAIGKELDKLTRTINDMTPVSELPINVRPKSRKEKNKLASRACRLKKKAQHEANKIKLCGLQSEHKLLLNGLNEIRKCLLFKYTCPGESSALNNKMENISQKALGTINIAGNTTEFVNQVLENVKNGNNNGGLNEIKKL